MKLAELCTVIEDLNKISVTIMADSNDYSTFCELYRFHSSQTLLTCENLSWILENLEKNRILCVIDELRIRFIFFWIKEQVVAIGPYCTETLTKRDFQRIRQDISISPHLEEDFLAYQGSLPVSSETKVLSLANYIFQNFSDFSDGLIINHIDFSIFHNEEISTASVYKPYSAQVEERYFTEQQFMKHIQDGNDRAAINDWNQLHNSVNYLKKTYGYTIETARMSAAVTRTVIRIATMNAGVPAEICDRLTANTRMNVDRAKSLDSIYQEDKNLIKECCNEVRKVRNGQYSPLVMKLLYVLDNQFMEDLAISDLAAEQGVSENYLIRQFRKEIGEPPKQYLMHRRLEYASTLLSGTRLSIQELSSQCGIPDSNYFSKLFKREYHVSPSEYRMRHFLNANKQSPDSKT